MSFDDVARFVLSSWWGLAFVLLFLVMLFAAISLAVEHAIGRLQAWYWRVTFQREVRQHERAQWEAARRRQLEAVVDIRKWRG